MAGLKTTRQEIVELVCTGDEVAWTSVSAWKGRDDQVIFSCETLSRAEGEDRNVLEVRVHLNLEDAQRFARRLSEAIVEAEGVKADG